jgi:lauroyl/myristoyl acyltransferase
MKLTVIQLFHMTPVLRRVARQIHPFWFFRGTLVSVTLSSLFWPHTRKLSRPFYAVLAQRFDRRQLRKRAMHYLLYMRLFKDLVPAWTNWEYCHPDWISVQGEGNLKRALQRGRGVILISAHNYGFGKFVAPALAVRGYQVNRAGNGKKGKAVTRWRRPGDLNWRYLSYKGDYWHHLEVLKAMRDALQRNEIVHISVRGYRQGEPETAIMFLNRKFFLDPIWFRMIKICQAPALPCFAIGDINGIVKIVMHDPLGSSGKSMAKEFGDILVHYLTEYPEFGRMWKAISLERERW